MKLVDQYMTVATIKMPEMQAHVDTVTGLRDFIKAGEYRPGDRLPSERDLIGRLAISRSALRKAFDVLEREGCIWRHVGKGTFIASTEPQNGSGSLAELILQVTPITLMRARLSVEPAIAREAALNASESAVSHLSMIGQSTQDADNWDDYELFDDQFHRAIGLAADNPLLLSLFDHLNAVRRGVAWKTVVRSSARPASDHTSFAEHDKILSAIEARDPTAAHAAMRTHLVSVSNRLFGDA